MIRTLAPFFVLLLIGCGGEHVPATTDVPPAADTIRITDSTAIVLQPLTSTGLKFDGVYHWAKGDLRYYMRFFERGTAAFVGGTESYKGQLAEMLTINVRSGWNQVHNCPVEQRSDSLFIRSVGMKGVINYLGEVRAQGDSVRFLKVSDITGTRELAEYHFLTDAQLEEERAKVVEPK